MLDDIFQAIFSIIDITGTVAGTENKSLFLKIIGVAVWIFVLVGIVWMFVNLLS
jgi:hypothetical protein